MVFSPDEIFGRHKQLKAKDFIVITLITSLWVQVSEVFRFFVFVKPEIQRFLSGVPNVAPMDDLVTLIIWGVWGMLLRGLTEGAMTFSPVAMFGGLCLIVSDGFLLVGSRGWGEVAK